MRIKGLKIKNFLSFSDFEWKNIDPNLNIIVGPNGSGKTNLFNAFRVFSDLLNYSNSSELLGQIKNFAHLGNQNEPIELSMNIDFEENEKKIILVYIRACLIDSVSSRGFQFDSLPDEVMRNFLTMDDIAELFQGNLIVEYDFYSSRWNIRYEAETYQWVIDGNYSGNLVAQENGEGLAIRLRDKFKTFLKTHFTEQHYQQYADQVGTKISSGTKTVDAIQLSLNSGNSYLKSVVIFRNLINASDDTRGYSLRNFFGWLLNHGFVFTDNIRDFPKTNYSSDEIDGALKNDSINSKNIAFLLHRLKNGNLNERERFGKIQGNFKTLTEGWDFDISSNLISEPIQANRTHNLGEGVGIISPLDNVQETKREISISLNLKVIKDEHEFPLRYTGAGTWEALYFSCLMEMGGYVFFLDEPVANVHPNRQKIFSKTFQNNTGGQIFISTHSPYLTELEEALKISRFDLHPETKSTVRHYCSDSIEQKTLGLLSRSKTALSSLFSKGVILTEGETENVALQKWFVEYFGFSFEDKNIILIPVGGKEMFKHYLKLLRNFDIPWVILCDGDAIKKSDSDARTIGFQLEGMKIEVDSELKARSFQERKTILNKFGVFTTAQNEDENFESMKVFSGVPENGKSKPERGYEVASNNPCPNELKECFFDKLKELPRWKNILKTVVNPSL